MATGRAEHERFMREAIEEAVRSRAAGGIPVGSVIVHEGRVLARGRNEAAATGDVTAHAEMVALRRLTAERRVVNPGYRADSGVLAGGLVYTTYEPCPMCAWAICLAGLSTVVLGARFAQVGDARHGGYTIEQLVALSGQPLRVVTGVLEAECVALRRPEGGRLSPPGR